MAKRERIEVDELIWLIHQEVRSRIGTGRQFSFSVGHQGEFGWSVLLPSGGRPLHPVVAQALNDVQLKFQQKYILPSRLEFPD